MVLVHDRDTSNEGTAPAGQFRYAAQPVYNQKADNLFFGHVGTRCAYEQMHGGLAPGQKSNRYFDVTKRVVDMKLWGIFLDIKGQVAESQENDNFCSFYVNNS